MGFIDYHGKKESRYSEVLDYARAQQEEDWKRKQDMKIRAWLKKMTGNDGLAELYIQDILKAVIVHYQEVFLSYRKVIEDVQTINGISLEQLWVDFTSDFVLRHIEPFHLPLDKKKKYFDSFQAKVFKVSGYVQAEEFYKSIAEVKNFRRFLRECFDPAWRDQQFYKLLYSIYKNENENRKGKLVTYENFLKEYRLLGVTVSLYLNHALMPRDDGWMLQESAEWNAIADLETRFKRGAIDQPDKNKIRNPLYIDRNDGNKYGASESYEKTHVSDRGQVEAFGGNEISEPDVIEEHQKAKQPKKPPFDRDRFSILVNEHALHSSVEAFRMLIRYQLPRDLEELCFEIHDAIITLMEAIEKFDGIYQTDISQFLEYYIPETLTLMVSYMDYFEADIDPEVLSETETEVKDSAGTLLEALKDKKNELYQYGSMELKARSKALESLMNQDGHMRSAYKLNTNGEE